MRDGYPPLGAGEVDPEMALAWRRCIAKLEKRRDFHLPGSLPDLIAAYAQNQPGREPLPEKLPAVGLALGPSGQRDNEVASGGYIVDAEKPGGVPEHVGRIQPERQPEETGCADRR